MNTANTMIANFKLKRAADKGAKSVSVWFNAAQIKAMADLLKNEAISRGTDGVRFYFGSDTPMGNNHKLHVKLLLVSTIGRQANPPLSTHGDYFDHTADFQDNFLLTETGQITNDQSNVAAGNGATLYNGNEPNSGTCSVRPVPTHYLDEHQAYNFVKARNERNPDNNTRDESGYNTNSDWFKICFISSLFNVIADTATYKLDGLRVYLGEGKIDDGTVRDVVILVPTHTVNGKRAVDYYDCLEGLQPIREHFCPPDTSAFGGGYDKGELCPTVCNTP
ncbi:hypothetical protein GALL_530230 [mine drainage metagenome]|uniref:Uncharacterized protein n=1 Tax=mine drainage metagenome TaxID=410659 RepID=A0A1J5P2X6_9ZZZZ